MRSGDGFSLFAVLAFDLKRMENVVADEVFSFRYGFEAAKLKLHLKGGQMAPTGRYAKIVKSRVKRSEKEQKANSETQLSGGAGLATPKFLGLFRLEGRARRSRQAVSNATVVETDLVEYETPVVQRHGDYWRVYGTGHPEGVLSGQILGDEKLCDILHSADGCRIRASVSVDLTDLWVETDTASQSDVIAAANRDAVCTALVARALRPKPKERYWEGSLLLIKDEILVEKAPAQPADRRGVR
ncbi:MAG TPA: hypothetical protein VMS43_09100 [Allosphingosinicella sp.]|nr:hypothetical protein [Allosphingosinicella sp.]